MNLNKALILDVVYPVGSIYMSVNSTSPQTLFGGTWESLGNGYIAKGDMPVITKSTVHSVLDGSNFASLKWKTTVGENVEGSAPLGIGNGNTGYSASSFTLNTQVAPSNQWVDMTKNASQTEYALSVYMWKRTA